ncbi:uncharacterized protein EI97DRAFT_372749 [Westerdykella ornata]|uniref:D-mandelate dehydrogenase-like protein n=1 Tax=Westerdykella ornata TaxID=318751 RepID=A0A6A6JQU8_WESOR|nr:uncharacterized protein EI97DRAFT_372749 [Westerdykella ornata]KAF2278922.1 hypothetical protein EI97DRAFT_372749 [Westerdykella ornata]
MSAATPTPEDAGLPPPPTAPPPSNPPISHQTSPTPTTTTTTTTTSKPTILHLGDDIRWNHDLYAQLSQHFHIARSYSMPREEFKTALRENRWGSFVAIYRPFWSTGGEMGPWDRDLISLLPSSCKIYASAGAGFDWVDTKALAERGIIYCNSAPACTESVASTALMMLLSTFHMAMPSLLAARSLSAEQFRHANQTLAARIRNPNGRVLGIIGLGRIGFRIAQKARLACEMRIWYHDVVRQPAEREEEIGATWCESLDELLPGADCVVLATPFEGRVLLSRREFAMFKPGARLVNIARGKLVDEDALVEALDEGRISAAALDVHANEPYVDERLVMRENVLATCHTAGASVESHVGFERLGMENLMGYFFGDGPVTPVNLQWLKRSEEE